MARRSVLAAVATVVLLASCDDIVGPPRPDPDLAGTTVEVAATWSGTERENFQAVLDAFAARTGATVRYTAGGNDLPVLLNSRIASGSPPDVALVPQPGVVAALAGRGALVPLSGRTADAVTANYNDAWQRLGAVGGTRYGFYFKVANKSVIWYRTESFRAAGVAPPATWDDLRVVSRALVRSGTTPMVAAGGDGWVLTDWFENAFLRIGGPEKYDRLARHEIPWTDPAVVETLTLLGAYWRTPRTILGGPAGAPQITFAQSIADVFGATPRAAMLFEGDFVAADITRLGRSRVGETAKVFPWPSIKDSAPAVVVAGDQAVQLKDTPGARAVMTFLASPEAAALIVGKGGFISANAKFDQRAYPDPTTRAMAAAVVDARVLRFDLSDLTPQRFGGGSNAALWVLLQEFLAKGLDARVVAQRLEDAAKKVYGIG
ncbi:ABC transporter substrate-binding protein [Micromonospora sp. AKA38]|uniref:ABC transporter substrate-binding protein n=1 Tax=Micromonospora sp. AKA38 TaxID=2733861 RepID=UPI0022C7E25A|nr:ABC transporter substrate-binding protein [Micromonospora sp. AKA38]GHJ15400.1 sugar ABC transporter substrate-binding protein [Micromonospora sp. AKA38]